MSVSWKGLVAGAGATAGALVLATTALTGVVEAQSPSPSPAPGASPAAAQGSQPATPPNRVYGTTQLNGQPAPSGTTVTALVGSAACGTTQVSGTGTYVIDVASAASQPGCGTDGASVSFNVGSVRSPQTTQWRQGAFTELNLTAQAATATPSPRPVTATPSPRPATATPPPPTTRPTTPPTVAPTTRPSPTAAPTTAPQRPAGPPAAAQPPAQRPAPAALPRTGVGVQADTSSTAGWAFGGLALAAIALTAMGLVSYRRSR